MEQCRQYRLPLGAVVGGAVVDEALPHALGVGNGVALVGAPAGKAIQAGGQRGGAGVGTACTGGQICGGAWILHISLDVKKQRQSQAEGKARRTVNNTHE